MLGFMLLAIAMGLLGNLCATFITVFGGYAILNVLHPEWSMSLGWVSPPFFSLHWRGASCATLSNPATISSPSSSWP